MLPWQSCGRLPCHLQSRIEPRSATAIDRASKAPQIWLALVGGSLPEASRVPQSCQDGPYRI